MLRTGLFEVVHRQHAPLRQPHEGGVVGFAAQFPTFLLSPLGGVWSDRSGKVLLIAGTGTPVPGVRGAIFDYIPGLPLSPPPQINGADRVLVDPTAQSRANSHVTARAIAGSRAGTPAVRSASTTWKMA